MQLFGWFRTSHAEAFGKELAAFMLSELEGRLGTLDTKGAKKRNKVASQGAVCRSASGWRLSFCGCLPVLTDESHVRSDIRQPITYVQRAY